MRQGSILVMTRALAALVAAGVALAACSRRPDVPVSPGAPVVLISIDTLRADRLPAYGYRGGGDAPPRPASGATPSSSRARAARAR